MPDRKRTLCHLEGCQSRVLNGIASATELVVRFGNPSMLDHGTITILEGARVGLVGRNGSGSRFFCKSRPA